MGENEELGWFPRYTPSEPMCNVVGCATQVLNGSQIPSDEDYAIVGSSDAKFLPPPTIEEMEQDLHQNAIEYLQSLTRKQSNCSMRYKDGMIVVDELTPISEETAQQINKAFEDIRKTMGKDFPMSFTKRKARKYYKPKFTL